jgi:MFS family permease
MRRNLRLLPWWWVLRWTWLGEGIWVLYLTDQRGLTLGQALVFEALYSAVVIATELPTGMVADRFGRRISLIVGTVFIVLGFLTFGTGASLVVLMFAYAFLGLGETSYSGADTAMLYDSLKTVDRGHDFTLWHGRLNALIALGIAGFTIVGALMVRWLPLWTPIVASAVLSAPAIILAWLMTEPPRSDERRGYLDTGREAILIVARSMNLLSAMLLMGVTTVAIAAMAVLQQHFLREAGVPIWGIGFFVAGQMGLAALGSWLSAPIGRWLGLRRLFWLMPLGSAAALLAGAGGSVYLYAIFIFPALGWNVLYPHFIEYVATRVTQSVRATVISIANVVSGIASIILIPLVGLGVDRIGREPATAMVAVFLVAATVVTYLAWARTVPPPLDGHDAVDTPAGPPVR